MSYTLLIYSLKAGVCLAVFYLFFRLLLSRETFHAFNRLVLLGGVAVSFLLPLCVITVWRELPPLPAGSPAGVHPAAETPLSHGAFAWRELVGGIYVAGAVVTLLRVLWSLGAVRRQIRRGRRERLADGVVLVHTAQRVIPFSWGRYVVVSDADWIENGTTILTHERAHVHLHHTADLLVTDLAACLQWFNPAIWLLRHELRTIHEYEADEAVLRSGVDARSYQLLLVRRAACGREIPIVNNFNQHKLKKRITMMLQKRSPRRMRMRVLLLLPLVGLALGAFAQTRYVIPDGKDAKGIRTIRIEGSQISTSGIEGHPLILVDGERVGSLDSIRPGQIASVTVRKDSLARATYGEEARDGVILVTLRKPGESSSAASDSLAGFHTWIESSSDGTTRRITLSGSPSTLSGSTSALDGQPTILVDGQLFHGDLNTLSPDRIGRITVYKGANVPEEYRRYVGLGSQGLIVIESRSFATETTAEPRYNTVVGGRGGMVVTGPEVMSKSRTEAGRSVTIARGRVTADFSEIDETDYRIEIDGHPATMADLERIEPGKIRRVESISPDTATGRKGELRVRTRK